MKNTGLHKAIKIAGNQSELARRLGVSPQLVQYWSANKLPSKWVTTIHQETGVPLSELLPPPIAAKAIGKTPSDLRPDIFINQ